MFPCPVVRLLAEPAGFFRTYTENPNHDNKKETASLTSVGDWRLYDSIYTERYMGLLSDNKAGYDESSPILNASKLKGHLLLIHSMLDDNVHPANTMQLLTALTNAGKDVELRLYPPGHHGAGYSPTSRRLINGVTDAYLARYFKGEIRDVGAAPR